jgi:hypothetical protein
VRAQRDGRERAQVRGRVVPGGVEQLVLAAEPTVEGGEQALLAAEPVGDVLAQLGVGVPDLVSVAGAQDREVELLQVPQAFEVGGELARHEDAALTEHGVAAERGAAGDEREVVVGVARQREHAQGTGLVAVGGARPARDDRYVADPLAQRVDALDVVLVVVRDRDARRAALGGGRRRDGIQVRVERRPGVDHPARDEPGVRAGEGERSGVVGADEDDAVIGEPGQRGAIL